MGLSRKEKFTTYGIGFLIGCVMMSLIFRGRQHAKAQRAKEKEAAAVVQSKG